MKGCYINGVGCVAAQKVSNEGALEEIEVNVTDNVLEAVQPSYKGLFPPAAGRRMAKAVKMGIYASTKALEEAAISMPDAIITGTGMGCLKDSEKFLKAMLDNDEQFLTPTSFIQSTHNTVGGQIALGLKCTGYNFTYVNGAVSFESALYDAKLQLELGEEDSILIGGVDEMSAHTLELFQLANLVKKKEEQPHQVLPPKNKGVVQGEGASFFAVQNKKTATTYAQVLDVEMKNRIEINEVTKTIDDFLHLNGLTSSEIDLVVLGNNGDIEFDTYYDQVQEMFKATQQVYYKHVTGEFNTSSSIGLNITSHIVKNQFIEEVYRVNSIKDSDFKTVLIYNQYRGIDHSFTLLKKC